VIQKLKNLGMNFKKVSLPHTKYAVAAYYIIVPAEVSSNLARFDGIRYGERAKDAATLNDVYTKNSGRRIRRGSKAAHHSWHVRFVRWLL